MLIQILSHKQTTFTLCLADFSLSDANVNPFGVNKIHQSTKIPVRLQATLTFNGRPLLAALNPQIGFEIYLSDQDDITPSADFAGGSPRRIDDFSKLELSDTTSTELSVDFVNGGTYMIVANTEVEVDADLCAAASHMCVKYVMANGDIMEPPFRELDYNNDADCVDVSSKLSCSDGECFIISISIVMFNVVIYKSPMFTVQLILIT